MYSIFAVAAFVIMAPSKVEGPYTHGKLAVYVVRGPQADSRSYITLDEGLKSGAVKVRERGTGEVNTLEVQNGSEEFLFLHVGDIIRGTGECVETGDVSAQALGQQYRTNREIFVSSILARRHFNRICGNQVNRPACEALQASLQHYRRAGG